jgi:hypothetical protein
MRRLLLMISTGLLCFIAAMCVVRFAGKRWKTLELSVCTLCAAFVWLLLYAAVLQASDHDSGSQSFEMPKRRKLPKSPKSVYILTGHAPIVEEGRLYLMCIFNGPVVVQTTQIPVNDVVPMYMLSCDYRDWWERAAMIWQELYECIPTQYDDIERLLILMTDHVITCLPEWRDARYKECLHSTFCIMYKCMLTLDQHPLLEQCIDAALTMALLLYEYDELSGNAYVIINKPPPNKKARKEWEAVTDFMKAVMRGRNMLFYMDIPQPRPGYMY